MTKAKATPLFVGARVTTKLVRGEEKVVRTVTRLVPDDTCDSGWRAIADGGDPCPMCGQLPGKNICGHHEWGVDAGWFGLVEEAER